MNLECSTGPIVLARSVSASLYYRSDTTVLLAFDLAMSDTLELELELGLFTEISCLFHLTTCCAPVFDYHRHTLLL